jgi:predicted Rossmann-fold nucleotide-binding protein
MYKSVAVFCGSNSGSDPIYEQHAKDLGTLLAENYITLVYGGGNTGLMGAVANAALAHNGKVIGVIP